MYIDIILVPMYVVPHNVFQLTILVVEVFLKKISHTISNCYTMI